jgi:hypothetical protein
MSVRAKFVVTSITRTKGWAANGGEVQTIRLSPVTSGSDENKSFFAATPSGQIELGIVNADAVKEFDLGAEMYVEFTPANAPQS